ncbi:hypothetical protein [Longimicrobium sp.]|uniref:hypothetical protein n=1 Tax=Longimicrobium sp. TaxID=2029185 RepID=UPI0039C8D436
MIATARTLAIQAPRQFEGALGDDERALLLARQANPRARLLRGHLGGVYALAVDSARTWLASGGADSTVRVWDLSHPGTPSRVLGRHAGGIRALAFGVGGSLVSAGADSSLRFWRPSGTGASAGVRRFAVDVADVDFRTEAVRERVGRLRRVPRQRGRAGLPRALASQPPGRTCRLRLPGRAHGLDRTFRPAGAVGPPKRVRGAPGTSRTPAAHLRACVRAG